MARIRHLKKYQIIRIVRVLEKSVKLKCYDCMGGRKKIDCEITDCPLFLLRPWVYRELKRNLGKIIK